MGFCSATRVAALSFRIDALLVAVSRFALSLSLSLYRAMATHSHTSVVIHRLIRNEWRVPPFSVSVNYLHGDYRVSLSFHSIVWSSYNDNYRSCTLLLDGNAQLDSIFFWTRTFLYTRVSIIYGFAASVDTHPPIKRPNFACTPFLFPIPRLWVCVRCYAWVAFLWSSY